MRLEHSFTVPVPVDKAWEVLLDIERIAPCMPGATLDTVEGEEFTGQVKVKVGPITVTYRGQARFADVDAEQHRATIEAKGTETRGSGTARATIAASLAGRGDETDVEITTDLAITGKPAQFGRGVMADVGGKLIGQFADCLSSELGLGEPGGQETTEQRAEPAAADHQTQPAPAAQPVTRPRPSAETIDLLDVAGAPLGKRLAPVAVALALVAVVVWLIRRRT